MTDQKSFSFKELVYLLPGLFGLFLVCVILFPLFLVLGFLAQEFGPGPVALVLAGFGAPDSGRYRPAPIDTRTLVSKRHARPGFAGVRPTRGRPRPVLDPQRTPLPTAPGMNSAPAII